MRLCIRRPDGTVITIVGEGGDVTKAARELAPPDQNVTLPPYARPLIPVFPPTLPWSPPRPFGDTPDNGGVEFTWVLH